METVSGTLYGVGVGPGDPELITVKAVKTLRQCQIIAYPASKNGNSLARHIAAEYLADGITEIAIPLAMDPNRHPDNAAYDRGAMEIAKHLTADQDVAVLCEGDPLFYGSFVYLLSRLSDKFETEIIPGVTSLSAGATAIAKPLVSSNQVLKVLAGPSPTEDLRRELKSSDAAVIIKLGRHGGKIFDLLLELDLLDQANYVEFASHKNQKTLPLRDIDPSATPYLSMIIINRDIGPP